MNNNINNLEGGSKMKKYVCLVCGYVHDESQSGPWEDLPESWVCPLCKATKDNFKEQEEAPKEKSPDLMEEIFFEDAGKFSDELMSVVFSNLAKGCEKQYQTQQAELFTKMADYYESRVLLSEDKTLEDLKELLKEDLNSTFDKLNVIAGQKPDRGALRALGWGEKVSRILESILGRESGSLNIHVCEICGFIYIGEDVPEICPVCKVPKLKISKVEGGR